MEYNFIKIGDRIRAIRKSKNISQDNLIEVFGNDYNFSISRNTLSKIENGDGARLTFDFLLCFSKWAKCDIGYLLGEYDEKTQNSHQLCEITGLNETSINFLLSVKSLKIGDIINIPVEANKKVLSVIRNELEHPIYIINILLNNPHIIGMIQAYMCVSNDTNNSIYQGDKGSAILFDLMIQLRKLRDDFQEIYIEENKI